VQVAVSRPDNQRPYDFRPPDPNAKPPPGTKAAWRIAMKENSAPRTPKPNTNDENAPSNRSSASSKNVLGFTRFLLRGIEKVKTEWLLVTLAYNCKRLSNLKIA